LKVARGWNRPIVVKPTWIIFWLGLVPIAAPLLVEHVWGRVALFRAACALVAP